MFSADRGQMLATAEFACYIRAVDRNGAQVCLTKRLLTGYGWFAPKAGNGCRWPKRGSLIGLIGRLPPPR